MDPSLPPPPPSPISTTTTTTTNNHQGGGGGSGYTDSIDSSTSPRSRNNDSWENEQQLPQVIPNSKLRLMCSYGGHIIPRPHDKSLCYIGGDTRIVVVDRHSSLVSLSSKISRTLLNGRSFTLKYQLPNEDLDSLISVSTDEDLENMIEEYDRTSAASVKTSRIRLFLFFSKPETAASMGSLLDDSKSESWFVDALNGSGNLPRGLSADSASVNCLLGLDDVVRIQDHNRNQHVEMNNQNDLSLGNLNKQMKGGNVQDVQSIPDSPMMETNSSFGSTTSSPSMSNLPPIRVHVEDQKVAGLEDHFSHMNIAPPQHKQDEGGFALLSSPPPLPTTITVSAGVHSGTVNASGVVNENSHNRVYSDDERSEYGFRKPPQPPQPQLQQKTSGGVDLPSPDGTARDSIPNMMARPKQVYYQEQVAQQVPPSDSRIAVDPKRDVSDLNYRIQMQQQQQQEQQHIRESGYALPPQQLDQQQQQHQFISATGTHYIQQHGAGQVPISSPYYHPMYVPQQPQQHLHQMDQQIPMYYVPVHQTQSYSMSMQPNMSETSKISSNRPPTPPTPTMVSTSVAPQNPGYPPRSAPPPKQPEMASTVYRTTAPGQVGGQQMMHTATDQHQQPHFVSYHPMHHPSQSIQAPNAGNYAYEYSDPNHAQIYYTQPLTSHYQTMSVAQAVAAVSDATSQIATDQNTNKQ
ncbi:hypothetical protein C5167_023142 [Papaver somniferum]|uniref:PB1 domain-containing protein n=1 Tax=Papaver somniferum TaxID=3469 RepID=A0A4Y7JN01_PAPSO|nr:alpha-protein kinase 1-like [Papaver somniferum]RZC61392.1 hypothetical protein C5167_023142 [Papaver somniferum]